MIVASVPHLTFLFSFASRLVTPLLWLQKSAPSNYVRNEAHVCCIVNYTLFSLWATRNWEARLPADIMSTQLVEAGFRKNGIQCSDSMILWKRIWENIFPFPFDTISSCSFSQKRVSLRINFFLIVYATGVSSLTSKENVYPNPKNERRRE